MNFLNSIIFNSFDIKKTYVPAKLCFLKSFTGKLYQATLNEDTYSIEYLMDNDSLKNSNEKFLEFLTNEKLKDFLRNKKRANVIRPFKRYNFHSTKKDVLFLNLLSKNNLKAYKRMLFLKNRFKNKTSFFSAYCKNLYYFSSIKLK